MLRCLLSGVLTLDRDGEIDSKSLGERAGLTSSRFALPVPKAKTVLVNRCEAMA